LSNFEPIWAILGQIESFERWESFESLEEVRQGQKRNKKAPTGKKPGGVKLEDLNVAKKSGLGSFWLFWAHFHNFLGNFNWS